MDAMQRRILAVVPPAEVSSSVARLIWMVEDTRQRTLQQLTEVDPAWVDWRPPGSESIGTVLYHLAAIEASWTYEEILMAPFPAALEVFFPYAVRDEQGRLHPVAGEPLDRHLERLAHVRAGLLAALRPMDETELRRPRSLPDYDVTPEWVLHHLMQHEAEHRGQIGTILALIRAQQDVTR